MVHDRRNDFQDSPNPAGAECLQVLLGSLTRVTSTYPGFVAEGRGTVMAHTLGQITQSLLAFSGLAGECMERDPGWRFMDAGRRIERGVQLASLLRASVTVERGTATDMVSTGVRVVGATLQPFLEVSAELLSHGR